MIDLWGDEAEIATESETVDVDDVFDVKSVSYTHLTLPTICSV